MVSTGDPAPELSLLNTERKIVDLTELRGRKVVVALFPAAFTSVCTKEMCSFRDSLANLNALGAQEDVADVGALVHHPLEPLGLPVAARAQVVRPRVAEVGAAGVEHAEVDEAVREAAIEGGEGAPDRRVVHLALEDARVGEQLQRAKAPGEVTVYRLGVGEHDLSLVPEGLLDEEPAEDQPGATAEEAQGDQGGEEQHGDDSPALYSRRLHPCLVGALGHGPLSSSANAGMMDPKARRVQRYRARCRGGERSARGGAYGQLFGAKGHCQPTPAGSRSRVTAGRAGVVRERSRRQVQADEAAR